MTAPEDPQRKAQVKAIGHVLVGMMPQAAPIAFGWAEELYGQGIRFHPELAHQPPPQTELQKAWADPAAQQAVTDRAMGTLREMAKQFPYLRPVMQKVEQAKTPEECARALVEFRGAIAPEVFASAEQQIATLRDDSE